MCKLQTHGVVYRILAVVHIIAHNLIIYLCRIPGFFLKVHYKNVTFPKFDIFYTSSTFQMKDRAMLCSSPKRCRKSQICSVVHVMKRPVFAVRLVREVWSICACYILHLFACRQPNHYITIHTLLLGEHI